MIDWQVDNVSNNNRVLVAKRLDTCECYSRSMLHVIYYSNKENLYTMRYYERIGNENIGIEASVLRN